MFKMISYNNKNKAFEAHYENGLYQANFNNLNLKFLKKIFKRRYSRNYSIHTRENSP